MALDRRITVTVREPSTRDDHGEDVLGAAVDYPTWATVYDRSLEDIEGEGGTRNERRRDWRIRWDSRFIVGDLTRIDVQDGADAFNVLQMNEDTGRFGEIRRRWLGSVDISRYSAFPCHCE